ncbi:hypothetical protein TIFTF001_049966 [Ficus carica]|uniref:Uncharacterized protein n=1 Tax=Ficus carica TaxID=3494 RepID=A0AA87YPT4_FICCA|nr:hypothetical protein TIFTF001_049966 [Ficus carica]
MTEGRTHVMKRCHDNKAEPTFSIPDLGLFSGERSSATTYFPSQTGMLVFILQVEPSKGEVVGEEIANANTMRRTNEGAQSPFTLSSSEVANHRF